MYTNDHDGVARTPAGWGQLQDIKNLKGKSSTKDPDKGQVRGLHYKIEFVKPLIEKRNISACFKIFVNSWHYNIYNEWHEYPVLSFLIQDRTNKSSIITKYISDVKIMTHAFPVTIALTHRLLIATSFFIKKIDNGIVPDVEQILTLHKIHPSQKSFYKDQSAEDVALLNNLKELKESDKRDVI